MRQFGNSTMRQVYNGDSELIRCLRIGLRKKLREFLLMEGFYYKRDKIEFEALN